MGDWFIGEKITQRQEELGWGKSVAENLSKDLTKEFSSVASFSPDNLLRMRQMYAEYSVPKNINRSQRSDKTNSGTGCPIITNI